MAFDYAEMQAVANELITEFGQSGTVKRETPPDPVYGGEPVVTSYPCTLFPNESEQRYQDGTSIMTTVREIYVSSVGLPIEVATGDVVTVNGIDHAILDVEDMKKDATIPVVFICTVKA